MDDSQVSPTTSPAPRQGEFSRPNAGANERHPSDMGELANYRRDLAVLDTMRVPQIHHNPPTAGPNSQPQNAPWLSSSAGQTSFLNDSSDSLSVASQLSPGYQSSINKPGAPTTTSGQDSPDAMSFDDGRRPSVASIATASSSGSKTSVSRGGFRKLQGFFGEEFPGRDNSESSITPSNLNRDPRGRSYSSSRPTHRDRKYSNATDHARDPSPAGYSRPRTPVPAPEVVPFLYQDNSVRTFQPPLPTPRPDPYLGYGGFDESTFRWRLIGLR
jgi:adenylate cyclase